MFDALSAIDIERVDWREVVTEASLAAYAAQRVGLGPEEVLPRVTRRADPLVVEILEHAVTTEIDLVRDSGYREVLTPSGPVLVESDGKPGPEAGDDLLSRAFALVELLVESGGYEVTDVGLVRGEVLRRAASQAGPRAAGFCWLVSVTSWRWAVPVTASVR